MELNSAIILKDGRYIPIFIDNADSLCEQGKIDFVNNSGDIKTLDIDENHIETVTDLDTAKGNHELKEVKWYENHFIIFLENEELIKINKLSLNPMTMTQKSEFAIQHLKDSGINPDKFDHIGDEQELSTKTNIKIFSFIFVAAIFASFIFYLYS